VSNGCGGGDEGVVAVVVEEGGESVGGAGTSFFCTLKRSPTEWRLCAVSLFLGKRSRWPVEALVLVEARGACPSTVFDLAFRLISTFKFTLKLSS